MLLGLLSSFDVASKEWIVRQYDHEVQGASVLKPLVGVEAQGPGDGVALAPVPGSQRGVLVGIGIQPGHGDLDPYGMALSAVEESLRNVVAIGGDPSGCAILDNFSWGNCDKPEQLGALVLAAEACRDAALAFGTPFISGKDSLNNEYRVGEESKAIPPTLLVSALAIVPDVRRCVSMDLKRAGNLIYQVGLTRAELGGSEYFAGLGVEGGRVPSPDLASAPDQLAALHDAIAAGLVRSCHDLSEGGLAVAACEMAYAGGLGLDAVMHAVVRGLRRGSEEFGVGYGLIVCAMRNEPPELSLKLAELAVAYRERGCVGFDLAGEEAGNPAKAHLEAFQLAKRKNFSITIHAGESFGPESIWQALQYCGAHRIGHATRLVEDVVIYDGKVIKLGTLAQYVLDHRIPIEVCLSSNVHTGATPSMERHPFRTFMDQGFRVTLNTDNRLMSRTSMTEEYMVAAEQFGCGMDELEKISINGMKSAFIHYDRRCEFIFDRIKPGFAALRAELDAATAK